MGGTASTEIPGGGTEGYHVLRVKSIIIPVFVNFMIYTNHCRYRKILPEHWPDWRLFLILLLQ